MNSATTQAGCVVTVQMLSVLYERGPQSSGLFRRSANYAKCQAAKLTLDAGHQFNFDEAPLPVTAALLKVPHTDDVAVKLQSEKV